jgi:hypothetical protein
MRMWLGNNSFRTEQRPQFEPLEDRRLLSAGVAFPSLVAYPGVDGSGQDTQAAVPLLVTRAAPKNVVGKYTGTFKITGYPQTVPANLNIKKQTAAGKVSGTISSPGIGIVNFAVKGTIDSKGNFNVTFNKNGISGNITGKVSKSGGLGGTFTAQSGSVLNVGGKFTFNKVS